MKICKLILLVALTVSVSKGFTQELAPPKEVVEALAADDSVKLLALVTRDNVNTCYGNYSLLSHAIRFGAIKCFNLLIAEGADVNHSCNGYVPPLMHAAKYGRLEMVKVLVARGADVHYKYTGDYVPAQGQTPLSYAQMYQKSDVVAYLDSLK